MIDIIKDVDNGMKTSKKKQKDDFKLIISGFNITLSFYYILMVGFLKK